MKTYPRFLRLFSLSSALSLTLALGACTPAGLSPSRGPVSALQSPLQQIPTTAATQTVHFNYKRPVKMPRSFGIRAVNPDDVKYIKLSLVGAGIDGAIYNSGGSNGFIAVVDGQANTSISGVPMMPGQLRIVTAQGYDAEFNPLPAYVGKGYYISSVDQPQVQIQIDRRYLLVGQALEILLQESPKTLTDLNLAAMQAIVDTALGYDPGTVTFSAEPSTFDPRMLADVLRSGKMLNAKTLQTDFRAEPSNVVLTISTLGGGIFTEAVTLRIDDPNSRVKRIALNSTSPQLPGFQVVQGTWNVSILSGEGKVLGTTTVTVNADGSVVYGQDSFVLRLAPQLGSFSPLAGPLAGNNTVTLTGTGFTGATGVNFGSTQATGFTVVSDSEITVTVPAGVQGNVEVSVVTPGGTATADSSYAYLPVPVLSGLNSTSGSTAGTNTVVLTGTGFTGASAVNFGSTPATHMTVDSDTQMTVTVPAGSAGTVDVTVLTPGGTSVPDVNSTYAYQAAPQLGSLSPSSGVAAGGTSVTLTGTGFTGTTSVKVGSTSATSFTVVSDTQITAVTPAGTAGSVQVTVVSGGGTTSTGAFSLYTYAPAISTVAGNGTGDFGGDSGAATSAKLKRPMGVAVDSTGNFYIADTENNRIRKVNASDGKISTVAGTGSSSFGGDSGAATSAQVNGPMGVAFDSAGNLYIADTDNHRIRKINASDGKISTVAGSSSGGFSGDNGAATSAKLNRPAAVTVDSAGNLYIADTENHRIRKVNASDGKISTVAGTGSGDFGGDNGAATSAKLNYPSGVSFDSAGNIYIADKENHRIRKLNVSDGKISTVAGTSSSGFSGDTGAATSAKLFKPAGILVDGSGNLYIGDTENHRVRKVYASTGKIYTVAGNGTSDFGGDNGAATSAKLKKPVGVSLDAFGNLYIADSENNRVRKVTLNTL